MNPGRLVSGPNQARQSLSLRKCDASGFFCERGMCGRALIDNGLAVQVVVGWAHFPESPHPPIHFEAYGLQYVGNGQVQRGGFGQNA